MWICAAIVVAALVVAVTTGNAFALLPVIGCVLMMVVMMQMMSGS